MIREMNERRPAITPEDLAAIDARLAAASFNDDDPNAAADRERCLIDEGWTPALAAVFAHAPEDLRRLRAEVERLRTRVVDLVTALVRCGRGQGRPRREGSVNGEDQESMFVRELLRTMVEMVEFYGLTGAVEPPPDEEGP